MLLCFSWEEIGIPGNTKAVQLVKPTGELVKTAVVNCAKVGVKKVSFLVWCTGTIAGVLVVKIG